MSTTLDPKAKEVVAIGVAISADARTILGPPEEGMGSETQQALPMSLLRNTRGYLEKVGNQVNGCYERGWYDGCTVMLRRLIETLIIEAFEHHGIAGKIKGESGDFLYLRDLISKALGETTWNLSRNTKRALPQLKDIGDRSAHSRRYNAHRADVDKVIPDLRVVVQEFVYLANLK